MTSLSLALVVQVKVFSFHYQRGLCTHYFSSLLPSHLYFESSHAASHLLSLIGKQSSIDQVYAISDESVCTGNFVFIISFTLISNPNRVVDLIVLKLFRLHYRVMLKYFVAVGCWNINFLMKNPIEYGFEIWILLFFLSLHLSHFLVVANKSWGFVLSILI